MILQENSPFPIFTKSFIAAELAFGNTLFPFIASHVGLDDQNTI